MTGAGPGGFLEFFILEAGDYVEQLDGVLLRGSATGPDSDALQRVARALRGTATMAKIPAFADLASGVERVGRALHEGALQWNPALGGALVAAIDDLKLLLRGARSWSPAEDQRAAARSAELARYAPPKSAATTPDGGTAKAPVAPASSFLGTEASNIAAGLELLTTRAGDAETAANVLRRVRALRGVAGVKEVAPLADVLEATEEASRGLESGQEPMSPDARQLLEAAAAYLRTLASALRGDGDVNAPSSARDAFNGALDAWTSRSSERERVVPIADLFYGDGAPGLVEASEHPPTSAAERFRIELVSLGEHLRQVVDAGRHAADTSSSVRARRDIRHALRAAQSAAQSFGERDVAEFVAAHFDATEHLDFLGLASLEDLASVLTQPGTQGERLNARLADIVASRDLARSIGAGFGGEEPAGAEAPRESPHTVSRPSASPLSIPTPSVAAQAQSARPTAPHTSVSAPAPAAPAAPAAAPPPRRSVPTPVQVMALDSASAALIDSGIAALEGLSERPLVEPTPFPGEELVPIETLLYRGQAALQRAVEIRDEIRRSGDGGNREALDELFDLLDLVGAE